MRSAHLASLLFAQGRSLKGLQKVGRDYWFQFDECDSCNQTISDYWKGIVSVDARKFVDSIKNLKSMIFSEMEKEKLTS
jgi:NMD protein affecting ribosome stability and mRNA decay